MDSSCMNSLISNQAFERLGLERRNANILVNGITDGNPSKTTGAVTLQISSRFDDRVVIVVEALILKKLVPDQPSQPFEVDAGALAEAPLADPSYNKCEPGKLYDGRGVPIAQNSVFGYLFGGHFNTSHAAEGRAVLSLTTSLNLDQTLRKFWEVEEVPKSKQLTPDELRAAEHFHSTLSRNESGRYVVRLPFDRTKPELGESATAAIRRFKAMERKFSINPELQHHYQQFMTEYLTLGHMEKVPPSEVAVAPEKSFYLPHHAVWKVDSTTTKEDADYLRIVWRNSPDQPLEHYRLLTVTYGKASAAYQAMAALRRVAEDNKEEHPLIPSTTPISSVMKSPTFWRALALSYESGAQMSPNCWSAVQFKTSPFR
ncbi:uncharacterized protein LOC135708666 [Ochlerotatus camptorhynchus]|uniref:uncharacterized protein LOC135708666 n=1 Tax=Ochlerotatus camptorhynchus TaxID=644619 RepID=UPI0031E4961C